MTVSLKHKFVSAIPDGPDATIVRPSNWNDEHELLVAQGKLIGRFSSGTGAAEEITIGSGLSYAGGTLVVTSGGTGTVTSVDVSGSTTGLTFTGGPITTAGTITLGGTLGIANGGTGATTAAGARANLSAAVLGANGDITSLTGITGGISSPDFVQFDTTAVVATATGRLYFNDGEGGLSYTLKGGNVSQEIGQSLQVLVYNGTGSTLTKGQVVYSNGAQGQRPTVALAIATSDATSARTLGIVAESIANGAEGWVTTFGIIENIDTSAFTAGVQLYLSGTTAGALTATKTVAPVHMVYVARCIKSNATSGRLFVTVQNGYELDELHDVAAVSPSNGQTIVYNSSNSLWEKNTVSLTIGVNGTLPIANGGTGATTQQLALNALAGAVTSGSYLRGNGTNVLMSTIQAADVPTLNQNTTGTAANVTGVVAVANGGTGATTLTGYVKGSGTTALTASTTIPNTDISGLGTMSTQDASAVAITGGTINGTTVGATTRSTGAFTSLAYNTTLTGGTGIVALGTSQFYKDASGNVGIGTASPLAKIHILDEASSGFYMDGYANSSGPIIRTRAARGTLASPAAVTSGTLLGGMRGFGYNGTSFGSAYAGGVNINAAETFTTIAQGTYVTINTTAIGAVATTERVRIDSAGNVGIGNTPSGTYALEVTGTVNATLIAATRVNPRIGTVTSNTTITPTGDASDQYNVTALAAGATIAIPSGTPVDGQKLTLRIKDNGTARALTWTTSAGGYRAVGTVLPTTTVISKTVYIGCIYNSADSFWDVVSVAQQA